MTKYTLMLLMAFSAVNVVAGECPVSMPNLPDQEGALRSSDKFGWYGSNELAAMIPRDGNWVGMGKAHNYRDKFWWWREGYTVDTKPALTITGRQLDGAGRFFIPEATNGRNGSDTYRWDAMLVGMEFPAAGCWHLTGKYKGRELDLVLNVGDS